MDRFVRQLGDMSKLDSRLRENDVQKLQARELIDFLNIA